MKKVLAMVLSVCMIMACLPAISFAEDVTITSSTTAFFTNSSSLSTVEGSSESGSSCVLVAWNGSDNWNAASTFTDTDGTVTSQTVTSGTAFGSSRQAIVSFNIPSDFDADNVAKVTLGLTVRYVKQINQAGARLAIYGNSVDGTWTTSTNKTSFGVSGSDSGTGSLPLLGLTSPLSKAGNNQVDETVTLSSLKLTEYIKEMANEGKTQVTFRLAVPYGGVWVYNSTSSYPATLTIEEGNITTLKVKTVYMDGNTVVSSTSETVNNVIAGSTYTYDETPAYSTTVNGDIYTYSEEDSTLSVKVASDGTSEVVLVYNKYDESQTFSGYEVDDEGAWCWFADPRSISYKNEEGTLDFSIIGYIDVHGSIKATQINHLTDEVNEVLIRSNIQPDDHNNPTFLVLPDERIIVFYSRHTDEACFWYRVTEEPGDLTTLGEEKCLNTSANTTYPSPFLMENDPDHIYLMWRGINWHPTIAKLSMPDEDGNTAFTYGPYQMVQSTAARPYAKYSSNGVDKLYVTYTLGHPDNEANNWIFFNQIDIATMTLEDVKGNTMSTISNGTLSVNATDSTQSHIVDAVSMRDWVWQVAEGDDGYPVIAMVRINSGKTSHDYYYAKYNGTEWVKTFLSNGGGAFHQSAGLEMCYSGGMAIDPDNTNIIYCSVPVEGVFGEVYEIVKYTMSDDGTKVLSSEQITYNSLKNNVRPFVIPNSEGKDIRLVWMYGDYYDWIVSNSYTTQGYCTAIRAEAALPANEVKLTDAVEVENYSSIGGAFRSSTETANIIEAELDGEFTVSADIYLEGDYEGTLLDAGDVQLSIETINTQYGATAWGDRARVVLNVKGSEYVTSNVYGSSDCWTTYGRGTGGNYGVENYQGYVNHILTYDGEYLTLYRDGLVDYKLKAEGLVVEDVTVGGFDGLADNVSVYDRVLNHDEIKALAKQVGEVVEPDIDGNVTITKTYVDIDGTVIDTVEETLPAGTEKYEFTPEETLETAEAAYAYDSWSSTGNDYTVVYYKTKKYGENVMTNGSFEDENGNFSVDGWYSPESGSYLGSPYTTDHFYAVTDTYHVNNNVQTTHSTTIPDGEWALGTRWNDGRDGLCSIKRYVAVEAGKTYEISYMIKHKSGADGGYIITSLVANEGDGEANTTNAGIVGTEWTRITRTFTATEETDHVLFWFRWLGNGYEGQGPYWYFDDFKIREVNDVEVVTVNLDGAEVKSYGTVSLGEDGSLPENVIGYHVTSGEEAKFVPAGELNVNDGDVITTTDINVKMVTGAQVRYGGGLDEDGKVSTGNGLRFIAQVDRSSIGDEVTGYGMKITAEDSSSSIEIPATKWQDGDSQTIFSVALTDLATSNYNRAFTAVPYVTVEYADGSTATIYSTEGITRSIYQVAVGLLKTSNNGIEDSDDEYGVESQSGLYDVLNAYVNMVGIRLDMDATGNFTARTEGSGSYTGEVFFEVESKKIGDGVYKVTITPVAENFANKVTITSYWDEFIRINNNHSVVVECISDSVINEDGSVTFTFTVPNN